MNILIVSCSYRPDSHSRILAQTAQTLLHQEGVAVDFLDLREYPLPHCDGEKAYEDPQVPALLKRVESAQGILVAAPIYNFDVNSIAKNFVELTGQGWKDKVVGFLCSAGGEGSYMSVMGIANSLMLDFRCLIIPRFVYTLGKHFSKDNRLSDPAIHQRILQLVQVLVPLAASYQPTELAS